jgi:hypothetical protein
VPDALVGISDLEDYGYPWAQRAGNGQLEVQLSPPRPPASVTNGRLRTLYNQPDHDHDVSLSEFTESSSPRFDGSVPSNPPPMNVHRLPSGPWVVRPSSTHPNQLPPISSLDFAQPFHHAWSPGDNGPFILDHQPRLESSPPQINEASQPSATLEGSVPQMNGQQLSPREVAPENNAEQSLDPDFYLDTFAPTCEFSRPCHMSPSPDGTHFRKIVSHLFGRNKASTKLFPDHVWVWYCRKHYQRARYRAAQWPFTQCELLLQSLDRMEDWGHVVSFELRLRRREALRNHGQEVKPAPTGLLENGRRHPTAITAPAPDWLQREVGRGKSFEDVRVIVEKIRKYLAGVQEQEHTKKNQKANLANGTAVMSKDEKKLAQNSAYREQNSLLRFPDIEILPTYDVEVLEQARKRFAEKKRCCGQIHSNDEAAREQDGDWDDEVDDDVHGAAGRNVPKKLMRMPKQTTRVSSRGSIKKPAAKKSADKKPLGKK